MYWGWLYVCVSVLTIAVIRKEPQAHAAIALVFWQLLGMTIYQFNIVETAGRTMAALVFVILVSVLWFVHRLKLFVFLMILGGASVLWALLYNGDAYSYKAGLNGLWLLAIASVWKSYFLPSLWLPRSSG